MTTELTPAQLTTLGHNFLAFAQAIGDYRYSKKLSPQKNKELSDMHWTLLNFSDDFYTGSASLIIHDVKKSLEKIKKITININESFQHIRNIQKAIDVATAAITLGAAIFSKSPKAINDALEKLEGEMGK